MSRDPRDLGFVAPGEELGFTQELRRAGPWPLSNVRSERGSGTEPERRPAASPYLFVPEAVGDVGVRPSNRLVSTFSPSIHLINDQGQIEFAPQLGATYRILALAGNAGGAPALHGMAEFVLGVEDSTGRHAEAAPEETIGLASFSVGSGEVAWALSLPYKYHTEGSVLLRVYDPLVDRKSSAFLPQTDRKTAARWSFIDVSGTWAGMETRNGNPVGPVAIEIESDWNFVLVALSLRRTTALPLPECTVKFIDIQPEAGRTFAKNVTVRGYNIGGELRFFGPTPGASVRFIRDGSAGQPNEYELLLQETPNTTSSTKMVRQKVGTAPPPPDKNLLSRVRRQISPTWSQKRIADANVVFTAISRALGAGL